MPILLFLFIVMPIVEMWILIEVGSRIGALATIGLVLLTAVVGLSLLRQQGFDTLLRVNQKIERGEMPATEVFEGIFLAVGGALLLTPGFVTDSIGFACLLPFTRRWIISYWLKNMQIVNLSGAHYQFRQGPQSGHGSGDVFEGEFRKEDPRDPGNNRLQ